MRAALLDVNVLIGLTIPGHMHHEICQAWFRATKPELIATCPIVQTGYVRVLQNPKLTNVRITFEEAAANLRAVASLPFHRFWPDDVDWTVEASFEWRRLRGPGQVTDYYLLSLAEKHGGTLVTMDKGIVALSKSKDLVEHIH